MADKNDLLKPGKICSKCGKRITTAEQAGSLTSYLFQPFNCTCSEGSLSGSSQSSSSHSGSSHSDSSRSGSSQSGQGSTADRAGDQSFCSDCGLQIVSGGAVGSITAFLFQDTRCKCPPRVSTAESAMAEKFWKLKQDEAGRTFDTAGKGTARSKGIPDHSSINLLPGAMIGGVYSIIDLIGSGGMGEIYRANHLTLGKVVALKLIPPGRVTSRSWQRFQNEARSIASLDHANLVRVSDLGIHEGCLPFYAMEYINGRSLSEMLAQEGRPPLNMVLDIFTQVCDGVDFAHRKGLVHRDLKPGNIMLAKTESGKLQVKILDFGLVKLTQKDRDQQSLTAVGDVMGSPYYMSPEQCIGGKVDNRSDIYSIGCTMFESLTGRPPFVGVSAVEILTRQHTADPPTLASIVGEKVYPESLEVVTAKLLRKNPVERYQTLLELRGDLEKVARGEEVAPFYFSRSQSATSGAGKNRTEEQGGLQAPSAKQLVIGGALALGLVLVIAAGIACLPRYKNQPIASTVDQAPFNPVLSVPYQSKSTIKAPASIKESAPFSKLVEEEGIKWRIFDFPKDCDLGELTSTQRNMQGATGVLKFRADERLMYTPGPVAVKYPSYLRRFRAGDIYEVKISSANFMDAASADETLTALSNVPGVLKLNLGNGDDLTARSAGTIDKFNSLKELHIGTSDLNVETIAKLKILNQLEVLRLFNHKDVSPVLKALRKDPDLKALDLGGAQTDLAGLESVAALPQLEELVVSKVIPDAPATISQCCRILKKAKKLQHLTFGEALTPADVETICSMQGLRRFHCNGIVPPSPEAIAASLSMLSRLPNIAGLSIGRLPLSADSLANILRSFKRLQTITINEAHPSEQILQLLKSNPNFSLDTNPVKNTTVVRLRRGAAIKSRIF